MNARPTGELVSQVLFLGDCLVMGSFGRALAEIPGRFPEVECFVINLECAVAEPDAPRAKKSYPLVASYADFQRVLAAFQGRQVVFNQANNHATDAGPAAKAAFFRWCGERGVVVVDQNDLAEVRLRNGTRLRLGAGHDTESDRAVGPVTCWNLPPVSRPEPNTVAIFLAHWGEEYLCFPSPRQIEAAQTLWDAGFQLIVGCHPHVVQGCRAHEGRQVCYSLGNGTMHLDCMLPGSRLGAALRGAFAGNGGFRTELLPYAVADSGALRFLEGPAAQEFSAVMRELSTWPDGAWWWRQQAAQAFFQNHLPSWRKRIQRHGFWEFARMVKAFTSRTYLGMCAARLAGLGRTPRNAVIAKRAQALSERAAGRPQPAPDVAAAG